MLLQRINSQVEVIVSDSGQGIAPDVLPFIFDRFRQAERAGATERSGLGLGLALVRYLVEVHGGRVMADSPGEGQGATFIVKLPLSIAQLPSGVAPRQHPIAGRTATATSARLDAFRILVVDDDLDALYLASVILRDAGAEVRNSLTARGALEILQQWRPDVLVADIEMPGEEGYALIREVRALSPEQGGRTPAVALTAYGRVEDRMRTLWAGYSMHVPKVVDPGELTLIIASLAVRA